MQEGLLEQRQAMPHKNISMFYRMRAAQLRQQAARATDEAYRDKLLRLAEQCEELGGATRIVDFAIQRLKRQRLTS